jgi:post-segregation antitoxin (ccd killing protein)
VRLNISVPDTLAEEVRQYGVPVSAVCQRALRGEVARLRDPAARDVAVSLRAMSAELGALADAMEKGR